MRRKYEIIFSEQTWNILTELKKVTNKDINLIIEEAIEDYLKKLIKEYPFLKLLTVPTVDDEENEELTKILESMSEEDWEIVEREEL